MSPLAEHETVVALQLTNRYRVETATGSNSDMAIGTDRPVAGLFTQLPDDPLHSADANAEGLGDLNFAQTLASQFSDPRFNIS